MNDAIARLDKVLEEATRLRQYFTELSSNPLPSESSRYPLAQTFDRALTEPRTIPRDVLQEIFIQCISSSRTSRMNVREAPMLLCRICSSWRTVALSTVRLWSSLRLDIGLYTSPRHRLRLENASSWISRSGAQPLVIDINCTTPESDWCYVENPFGYQQPALPLQASAWPFVTQFVEMLLGHSHRWKEISIQGPFYWITPLSTLAASQVPILERFSHRAYDQHPGTQIWKSMDFLAAQSLRELSLVFDGKVYYNRCPTTDLDRAISLFPLAQLTVLHLEGWGYDILRVRQLLVLCTSMEVCSIQTQRLHFGSPEYMEPFALPRLVSFSMCEMVPTPFSQAFFAGMDAPLLTHLDHYCRTEFSAPWIAPDSPFRFIQNLTLHIFDTIEDDIGDFLVDNIFLRRLRINRSPDHRGNETLFQFAEKHLVEHLMPDGEDGLLCPRLETFELYDCHSPPEELELFKLLSARSSFHSDDGIIHFKRVRITFKAEVDLDVFDCLDPLIESGLLVEIGYENLRDESGQDLEGRLVLRESGEFSWP
ncbi:hypothetical protein C8J56DRAFT_407185 [Mycena floridula]|nr:hypothetical protein C8J56DRAFT_407185 [Mycena floridula]